MKKIMILFCGGTIVMKKKADGSLATPVDKDEAIEILENIEPKLNTIANYDINYIANIDSTNMTPSEWDTILVEIQNNYKKYDGFIITHGTDTMAYSAAALTIGIEGLGKPIVLTGSQIPGADIETDARRNLINAMKLAIMDLSGVFIVFDEKVISGGRATKSSESKLDAFSTVNAPDAGEIRLRIRIKERIKKVTGKEIKIYPGFEPDIFTYTLTPGCDPTDLEFLLNNNRIKGIIIKAFGTGNIPDNFTMFFKKAKEKKLPIVVTSQCLHGVTKMEGYEVGKRALDLGVIEGFDQSLEMLAVKLMWAVKHTSYNKIRNIINKNYAGEIDKK